jgi:SH2 domain
VESCGGGRVVVNEMGNDVRYGSLHEFVERAHCRFPFARSLQWEPWYFDTFNANDADRALTGALPGTFFVRDASLVGYYVFSYVDDGGLVGRGLVGTHANGYGVEYFICEQEELVIWRVC